MAGPPVSLAASASAGGRRTVPAVRGDPGPGADGGAAARRCALLPKLWWHQVESTAPFNGLVNYWWDAFSYGPDAPYTSLLLSMITIAERPLAERQAWQAFFDHYVFRTNGHPLAHLPAEHHGLLGPLEPDNYSKIRARIMRLLRAGRPRYRDRAPEAWPVVASRENSKCTSHSRDVSSSRERISTSGPLAWRVGRNSGSARDCRESR